ncbi:MAG: type II secretion system F family protein, partial [Solirubrobacteraceae bacterium]
MTRAELLAPLAALVAAAAIVELATAAAQARRRAPSAGAGARVAVALARLGGRLGARAVAPAAVRDLIDAAGAPAGVGIGEVVAARWGAAVAAGLLAAGPAVAVLPGRLGLAALLAAPGAGFLAPTRWLARRVRRRRAAMGAELPHVLDLLAVAADAGMTPIRALGEVGRRGRGPLAAELQAAGTRAALGAPHADALAQLLRRCPVEGIDGLAAAVARAERHGAPLAPGV